MQPMLYIFKYVDFSFIFYVNIFIEDTAAVAAAKQEFFAVFDAATKGLITTVENLYIEGKLVDLSS